MAEEQRRKPSSSATTPTPTDTPRRPAAIHSNSSQDVARERPHVRFNPGGESLDDSNIKANFDIRDRPDSAAVSFTTPREHANTAPQTSRRTHHSSSTLDVLNAVSRTLSRRGTGSSPSDSAQNSAGHSKASSVRGLAVDPVASSVADTIIARHITEGPTLEDTEQENAQKRAQRLARKLGTRSAPGSATTSPHLEATETDEDDLDDIPLATLGRQATGPPPRHDSTDTELEAEKSRAPQGHTSEKGKQTDSQPPRTFLSEASRLLKWHNRRPSETVQYVPASQEPKSGYTTPVEEREAEGYVDRPDHFRGGVLSSLLKLYNDNPGTATPSRPSSLHMGRDSDYSPGSSGAATPRTRWYDNHKAASSASALGGFITASSNMLAGPGAGVHSSKAERPGMTHKRTTSGGIASALKGFKKPRLEDQIRITVHIAETLARQKYLLKLCRALMMYGAPTHRLEEYMKMSSRVLEIDGQFLYIPGTMLVSFGDASTRTSDMTLLRVAQGVDLGKLKDTHEVYKEVVHDIIGVEEATQRLEEIMKRKQRYNKWVQVFMYGIASATVCIFGFKGRYIDMPIAFLLGIILGLLQLVLAPASELYANVFEISAAVITSFLARAFGSINSGNTFCFSALAQASIALILPGYTVLCGSLELQSKNIVSGSVRMFYAIIYSLFLGFGITVGTAIYGRIDPNATSSTTCANPVNDYERFPFVILFTMCLIIINQGKWKQTPVMLFIAFVGYIVNFFTSQKFPTNAQIAQTLGAFTVGVLANLYSRVAHGLAAAALLPAIFVQVPSGIAATGSLISGLNEGNAVNQNGTAIANTSDGQNTILFSVGFSMIQVSIGISVGLFLAALVVYPLGKRRSGLFSF